MSVLVDTNILLRCAQPNHHLCQPATTAVATLLRNRETLFFCPQNIAEFWNVATRPAANNGLGMSHVDAAAEVRSIEEMLTLLPDSPVVYPEWKRIVKDYRVMGLKVYDARLVAIMNVNVVRSILTYNGSDFARYAHLSIIEPAQV
jgi:predicted nucleic acid-binding protein